MQKPLKVFVLSLSIALLCSAYLFADASLSYMEGELSVRRGGIDSNGEIGMALFQGDILMSGADGLAIVCYPIFVIT